MQDSNEVGICIDITTRMAIFTMAKSFNSKEIKFAFDSIEDQLASTGRYDESNLALLIKVFKDTSINIRNDLESK